MMRVFIIGGITPPGRQAAREVTPASISFTAPPPSDSENLIVEDLGVPGDRRRQNDARRFWPGGER